MWSTWYQVRSLTTNSTRFMSLKKGNNNSSILKIIVNLFQSFRWCLLCNKKLLKYSKKIKFLNNIMVGTLSHSWWCYTKNSFNTTPYQIKALFQKACAISSLLLPVKMVFVYKTKILLMLCTRKAHITQTSSKYAPTSTLCGRALIRGIHISIYF